MHKCITVCLSGTLSVFILSGCTSPFDTPVQSPFDTSRLIMPDGASLSDSIYRRDELASTTEREEQTPLAPPSLDGSVGDFVSYALFHSPEVERAYQQWRQAVERLPQVRALPDPRLTLGFYLNEVETRVGPQQARMGISQTFPWVGKLRDREDAAAKGALAAWYQYQDAQLRVSERVLIALYNLAFLDSTIKITQENYDLLISFEEVVRARYRVGAGSHPELIRVQVELGQLDDRVEGLRVLRPSYVASLNAVLNRDPEIHIDTITDLPGWVASGDAKEVSEMAQEFSPVLQSVNSRIEQARIETEVARKDGYPNITVGVDYVLTDQARNPSTPESGDDPLMLSFGMNLPIWREKYDAGVRASIARRLSISREFEAKENTLASQVYQSWFEHTDADRRVRLYERSLIPKAQESLSASLAGFRTGDSEFLDLLDTERTLLEFSIAGERARAERGKALATLNRLVGHPVPVKNDNQSQSETDINSEEVQP